MKVISILEDKRIKASNLLVEFSIFEYLEIADIILNNNPYQRKKVKSSGTVYSLLRDDLKSGCVIPPIVLAITKDKFHFDKNEDSLDKISKDFEEYLRARFNNTIILDGLQRTSNIIDANTELREGNDIDGILHYHSNKIRCEFYSGIDKIGILYRMLTLNTGQTPMSFRHQIEILYSDYLDYPSEGIRLVKETDDRQASKAGEYSFKEIIEGFTSYLMRDYLTFDKADVLSNIKSLEQLSKENQNFDIFKSFTKTYHKFQMQIQMLSGNWEFDVNQFESTLSGPPYGRNGRSIFDKSQSMTAFGAAMGFLKDKELITGFDDVLLSIPQIHFVREVGAAYSDLLYKLDDIRKNAPKIGNAQRAYFYYFFRELFNKDGDSYLVIDSAIENSYTRYRQNA